MTNDNYDDIICTDEQSILKNSTVGEGPSGEYNPFDEQFFVNPFLNLNYVLFVEYFPPI